MIDRKKRALWLNSVYRLTLKTSCKQLLWPDVRWIQEYRHCMLKIALIFISYFNNQCLASELTGSIIHERVDSINYGEQVTSSTVNLLVRWQIKKFNYKSHFIQPFTVQQTTSTRSKKTIISIWLVLWLLRSIFYRFMFNPTWLARDSIAVCKIRAIFRDVRGKV